MNMIDLPHNFDNQIFEYVPSISIDRLNEMNFNVFDVEMLDAVLDNDPDNFINNELNINIPSSVYVESQSFNDSSITQNFSLLNWNAVSVPENLQFFMNMYFFKPKT